MTTATATATAAPMTRRALREAERAAAAAQKSRPTRFVKPGVASVLTVGALAAVGAAAWSPISSAQANANDGAQGPHDVQQYTVANAAAAKAAVAADDAGIEQATGTATVQNLATPMAMRDAKAYTNNLSSSVQFPFPEGVPITDPYGMRTHPITGESAMHWGVDLTPGINTPIGSIAQGRVVFVSQGGQSTYGVYAVVEHEIDGEKVWSLYAHMLDGSLKVKVGDEVRVGDEIGRVGSTGWSTGAHLHLEVRQGTINNKVDPIAYLTAHNTPKAVTTQVTSIDVAGLV